MHLYDPSPRLGFTAIYGEKRSQIPPRRGFETHAPPAHAGHSVSRLALHAHPVSATPFASVALGQSRPIGPRPLPLGSPSSVIQKLDDESPEEEKEQDKKPSTTAGDQAQVGRPMPQDMLARGAWAMEEMNAGRLQLEDVQRVMAGQLPVRQELAKYLKTEGTDAHNKVSPDEFETMAKLYGTIDRGLSPLEIAKKKHGDVGSHSVLGGDEYKKFKAGAMRDIGTLMQVPSGRALLTSLDQADREGTDRRGVGIGLYANQLSSNPLANSAATPTDGKASTDGTGSPVDIKYVPGSSIEVPKDDLHFTSDSVLFHELSHANRMSRGQRHTGKLEEADLSPDHRDIGVEKEEFAAVGLGAHAGEQFTENQYRKEQQELHAADAEMAKKYKRRNFYNLEV